MATLTETIQGKLVFFDSAPIIYYVEQHSKYGQATTELFEAIDHGLASGITSVLSLVEVLAKPLREGRRDLAVRYRSTLMQAVGILVHPITWETSERAAQLRADHPWLRTPDALQVASALEHHADLVVTNDEQWRRIGEIRVIVLRDFATQRP